MQVVVGGVVLAAWPAGVRADKEAIRLNYSAPKGCPTGSEFEQLVFERTRSARPATSEDVARQFEVNVAEQGSKYRGTLTIRDVDQAFSRVVNGDDCTEIATVLALATALAIDPRAELDSHPDEGTPGGEQGDPAPNAERAPGAEGSRENPDAERDALQLSEPGSREPATDRRESPPSYPLDATGEPTGERAGERPRRRVGGLQVSLGPRLTVGATPLSAWGGALALSSRSSLSPLTWGIELSVQQTADKRIDDATADFSLVWAAPEVCVRIWRPTPVLEFSPCVASELGIVAGSGRGLPVERRARKFWASVSGKLKLDVVLSEDWYTSLQGGVATPLTRYDFQFDNPRTNVHAKPSVIGTAGLSLGYHF